MLGKAETEQDLLDPRPDRIDVAAVEAVLDLPLPLQHLAELVAGRIAGLEFLVQLVGLPLQGEQRGEGALGLLVEGLLRQQGARLLRQVADGKMARPVDDAVVGGGDPGHDLQQRRLAGAVDSDQTDTVAGMDLNRNILEQVLVAVTDIKVIDR